MHYINGYFNSNNESQYIRHHLDGKISVLNILISIINLLKLFFNENCTVKYKRMPVYHMIVFISKFYYNNAYVSNIR